MKRKPILIALSLLLVTGIAFAGNYEKGRKMENGGPRNEQCERLLSDTERDQVQDAKRNFEKVMIPMRADVKVLMMDIQDMVTAGKSSKEIAPVLDKLNAVKAKMASERLDHQVSIRKIVGEEKYKKMSMHRKMMMHNKGERGEQGRKMGGKKHEGRGSQKDCRFEGQGRNK